jgi:yecA family protein
MSPDIFNEAIHRLVDDQPLDAFCDWFALAAINASAPDEQGLPASDPVLLRQQRHRARLLWGVTPVPSNRWRARGLPKLERNAPCHCGSGRKYKQCCAAFEHEELPIPTDALLALALDAAEPKWLTGEKLRQVPPVALGDAAMRWNESGQSERTVAIVGPLFDQPKLLDERHEFALDALMDAMQQQGLEPQRRLLLDGMAQHPNKALATAARCRLITVLADQGEAEQAWKLFHDTSRLSPNDPQLWHLELTLLLSQDRQKEARLRAPLLAARARQAGFDDLAGMMIEMAEHGMEALSGLERDAQDDPTDLAWLALANATPDAPDLPALHAFYEVERFEVETKQDAGQAMVTLTPLKAQATLNQRWRRRFMVGKPNLTWLDADVDLLLQDLPQALAFLKKSPTAWLSAEVLDDLSLTAWQLCYQTAPSAVLKASQRVVDHAVAVLRALVGDAQLHWGYAEHRPLLRCLAVAIELAILDSNGPRALELLGWGLSLNPNDNHGWRELLAPLLMARGDHEAALALMAKYPDDTPPSEHLRAVALFALGRTDEAERVLREAHALHPLFLKALLPEQMNEPPPEPGPGERVGGVAAAWRLRTEHRPLWVRTGALAWAAALQLPDPPPPEPIKSRKTPAARPPAKSPNSLTLMEKSFGLREEKRLRKTCSDYPRLHGFLQAVAWSPQVLMPNAWLSLVMDMHDRMPNSRTEVTAQKALNDTLGATMQLYNHVNQNRLDHLSEPVPSLDDMLQVVGEKDTEVFAWAAGFVQGCELAMAAWMRSGHKVTGDTGPFGRLRALAARAAASPSSEGRVQQDDGRPLLLSLSGDEVAPVDVLSAALTGLWPVAVAGSRSV